MVITMPRNLINMVIKGLLHVSEIILHSGVGTSVPMGRRRQSLPDRKKIDTRRLDRESF